MITSSWRGLRRVATTTLFVVIFGSLAACSAAGTAPNLDDDLIRTAWDNDVPRARSLIERGADVNATDDTQQSAFLIAASEGHVELLDLTLRNGADVQALDSYQGTALIRAAERGHADIVGRLIRAGVQADHVNRLGWVGLHEALVFADGGASSNRGGPTDYVDTVRVLVAAGASITITARDGKTPLQLARDGGLDDQADLIERAAAQNGNVSRAEADRALLDAAERGDADAVAMALRQGANLGARNDNKQTALGIASAHDHTAAARLLTYLGADPGK